MAGRVAALVFVFAVAWAASVREAAACSCMPGSPCGQWVRSAAVFAGEVVDVQRADGVETTRIRVTRAYKGITPDTSVVTLISRYTSCSLQWRAGEQWAVYADSGPTGLRSSLCSGSRKLVADAPLPDLRPEPGVVDGWLVRSRPGPGVEPWIEGVTVWVETPIGRMASRTGPQGQFRLTGVPAGSWTVEFELGGREAAVAQAHVASPDLCASVLAIAEPVPR